jgi:hypothetical protein
MAKMISLVSYFEVKQHLVAAPQNDCCWPNAALTDRQGHGLPLVSSVRVAR